MLCRCGDLRDHHVREIRAARLDAFDLDAGQREQFGQLPRRRQAVRQIQRASCTKTS